MVPPPEPYSAPCKHPLPEGDTLTYRGLAAWLAAYQKALTDCDNQVQGIFKFYETAP